MKRAFRREARVVPRCLRPPSLVADRGPRSGLPCYLRFLRREDDPSMVWHEMQVARTPLMLFGFFALAQVAACASTGGASDVIHPRSGITAAEYYPLTDGWKWA